MFSAVKTAAAAAKAGVVVAAAARVLGVASIPGGAAGCLTFRFDPALEIDSPVGGEDLVVGMRAEIAWSSSFVDSTRVELSRDGGATWTALAVVPGRRRLDWAVTGPVSAECLVRVSDAGDSGLSDVSPAPFRIVPPALALLSPQGDESWGAGSRATVRWDATGPATVRVELSRDGNFADGDGSDVEVMAPAAAAGPGAFSWTVTGPASRTCLVRISSNEPPGLAPDVSGAPFTIRSGRVLHVRAGSPPGGDGLSWAAAFAHPEDALDAASPGDEVWIAGGVYGPRGALDRRVVSLRSAVDLFGGFAGDEESRRDRDPSTNATRLQGRADTYHVVVAFRLAGSPAARVSACDAVVDGLAVSGGRADSASGADDDDAGGGLLADGSAGLVVRRCSFADNRAFNRGGAVFARGGTLAIEGCAFTGNSAKTGGAVDLEGATAAVSTSVFAGNHASMAGGALRSLTSAASVSRTLFDGNCTEGGATHGGAAACYGTPVGFVNCVFRMNRAGSSGGALHLADARHVVTNCTFNGNSATGAGSSGGAIAGTSAVSITNAILWGNAAAASPDLAGPADVHYSDVGQGVAGPTNICADPLFVSEAAGDLRLSDSSPCIDRGTGAGAPPVDFDGAPRPAGLGCDMGAFER